MSALDDFAIIIEGTSVMQQMARSLREEPARLLCDICREYEATGQPVPDHHVNLVGFLGEASLRALVMAGLILEKSGSWTSLYCYEPTAEGIKQYTVLKASGFYKK